MRDKSPNFTGRRKRYGILSKKKNGKMQLELAHIDVFLFLETDKD
jgi:hypothetical protein